MKEVFKSGPFIIKSGQQNTFIMGRSVEDGMETAPDILFETVHPTNKEINYVMSFVSPEHLFSNSFPMDSEHNPQTMHKLHCHDFFELLYVITGEMYQQIETERHLYTAGSLCLLNCFIRHQEECSTEYRALCLRLPVPLIEEILGDMKKSFFRKERELNDQLLGQFFSNNISKSIGMKKEYIDFIPSKIYPEKKDEMYQLFEKLTKLLANADLGSTYLIKHTILQIFHRLSNKELYKVTPLKVGTDAETELFGSIQNLIHLSHGHISRKELEDSLCYSSSYLNRIVKKFTGMSIQQYSVAYAMTEAAELLRNTDLRISEICLQLQFSNQTYFYKMFEKTYGMTPKVYREKMKE